MTLRSFPSLPTLRATCLGVALALGAGAATLPAQAAAPQVKTQAGYFRLMLGPVEVTALSDGTVDLPVDQLLKEPAATTKKALARDWLAVPTETSVNAYLVNTGTKLVLVDTGAGVLFGPTLGNVLKSLRAAGYQPEQVDDILITHMHGDHVGGLMTDGKVAFPNATVHADKHDSDYWLSTANMDKAPADMKGFFQGAMASLNPYVAASKFQPITADGDVVPGIRSVASYGHTPGHTAYLVDGGAGHQLLLVGDLIHVGAVQFAHPEVTIGFDSDPKAAKAARAKVFTQAAKDGTLVGASHLSFPGIGHLRVDGKGYDWVPLNYTTNR